MSGGVTAGKGGPRRRKGRSGSRLLDSFSRGLCLSLYLRRMLLHPSLTTVKRSALRAPHAERSRAVSPPATHPAVVRVSRRPPPHGVTEGTHRNRPTAPPRPVCQGHGDHGSDPGAHRPAVAAGLAPRLVSAPGAETQAGDSGPQIFRHRRSFANARAGPVNPAHGRTHPGARDGSRCDFASTPGDDSPACVNHAVQLQSRPSSCCHEVRVRARVCPDACTHARTRTGSSVTAWHTLGPTRCWC